MQKKNFEMNRVKEFTLALCIACFIGSLTSHAVEAYPYWVDFRQPDGSFVKVRMRGNEFIKWAETEDGYTLLYDSNGFLVYAQRNTEGDIVPSSIRAVSWDRINMEVPDQVKALPKGLVFSERQINTVEKIHKARSIEMASERTFSPVVGTRRMLMILVEYQDVKFCHTKEDFDMLMNQINYIEKGNKGSVRDFFYENSFGKLELETTVVGIYMLPHERAYYGGNNGSSTDSNAQQMATDAVNLADADVNFSDFDNDGDGIVDGIHIIYAGPGEEAGGGADCVWAHSSFIYSNKDNVSIRNYSCSPEIRGCDGRNMTYIGVVCHELGHVLGCADFYDTNYSYGGQYQGTGRWDLMGSGNWNAEGACPAHFNPYIKIYTYGWATTINGNGGITATLKAKSENGFVRIDTDNKGEYFLLEYRSNTGFDKALPGHGLMVYHAYDDLSNEDNNIINAYHRQQFYPICANATCDLPDSSPESYGIVNSDSAPFPGSFHKKELTDYTIPSLKKWNSVESGCMLTEISEDIQGESVTLDINGGSEGAGAYNLRVTDSDLSSISLEWSNPENYEVMLVCHDVSEMGVAEPRDYMVGESLIGGGLVVFKGQSNNFKHTGLENNITKYYKIFSHMEDGRWAAGKVVLAKTEVGILRRFPYLEDFETGALDNSWTQEYVFKTEDWVIDDFLQTGNYKLHFKAEGFFSHNITRAVSPVIDFTGKKNAIFSFDCVNTLKPMKVCYRTTDRGEWKQLGSVDSDYDFDVILDLGLDYLKRLEKKYYFTLPELTSSCQIAFVGECITDDSSSNSQLTAIDNISIEVDYPVKVVTKPCLFVGSDFAEVPCGVYQGTAILSNHGVEWSMDGETWLKESATDTDLVQLGGLPMGTQIYYRYYAILEDGGEYRGDICSFTTMSFSKGKGTKDSPYMIDNDNDFRSLIECVNAGNTCKGQYFQLSSSVCYTYPYTVQTNGIFEGCLDGAGYTVNVSDGNYFALFFMLASSGKICNLNVNFTYLKTCTWSSAGICLVNKGVINNCHVICTRLATSYRNFGGVCYNNYGTISRCSSYYNLALEDTNNGSIHFGGIAWYNYGIINDCYFDGMIKCHNNSKIAGIVAVNYEGFNNGRGIAGIVTNCVNKGTLEVVYSNTLGTPEYNGIGGIAASNYGLVDQCKNLGKLINYNSKTSGFSCTLGGIVGYVNYGKVKNSYNNGSLIVPVPYDNQRVGAIAGSNDRGVIVNCVDMQSFSLSDTKSEKINGIVGWSRQIEIDNCYYTGSVEEQYATRCNVDTLARLAQVLNRSESAEIWNDEGRLSLTWEKSGIKMAMGTITEFTADRVAFTVNISGDNILDIGVEWRKRGSAEWNKLKLGSDEGTYRVRLDNLQPITCYEARLYATDADGNTYYNRTEHFATMFDSSGNASDPHLINNYEELLAFNELICHGEEFRACTIKLMSDIDLRGDKGVFWTSMMNQNNHESSFWVMEN